MQEAAEGCCSRVFSKRMESSPLKKKSKEINKNNSKNIINRSVSDSFSLSGKQTKQEIALSLVLNFCIVVNLKIILNVIEEKKQI